MKNNYEALNAQLLDELPRLYDLAIDIVIECIARLAIVQEAYHQKALDQMFNMLSVRDCFQIRKIHINIGCTKHSKSNRTPDGKKMHA